MIFVDSNIPVFLMGVAHPKRTEAQITLERSVAGRERLVCEAEVLQEIVHRSVALEREDALRAAVIVSGWERQSARDELHLAVMERYGIKGWLVTPRDEEDGLRSALIVSGGAR